MFSHMFLGVSDFERALAFYQPLMDVLGAKPRFCDPSRPWAGWQSEPGPRPLFVIGAPFNRQAATAGLPLEYHPSYYGAYFRDPDGNKLCVVCHEG